MPESDAAPQNRSLVWGLRCLGLLDLLALFAVVMPIEWMSHVNVRCGLGPIQDQQLVGYLARSSSALYALHGAMILFISCDVRRYAPLIRFLAGAAIVHGVVLLGIDVISQMPLFWTLLEAPGFAATGILVLWLQAKRTVALRE